MRRLRRAMNRRGRAGPGGGGPVVCRDRIARVPQGAAPFIVLS